ncbi:MAG: iron-dependent repressor, partial [Flavobacteriales bacterium 32-35-8]
MVTLSEENYLKAIYHLGKQGSVAVSTNAIAEQMETKASSVTDMIKKLADKNLVNYVKYQGVSLTKEGRLAAASVVRKHRLWEVLLVEKLNFSWDEVHEVAEQLEHIKSEKLINELDAFLNYPEEDPHGDPIPDKDGNIKKVEKILLSQVDENQSCICIGVKDSSTDFLKY